MGSGKAESYRLLIDLFTHALETWWKIQKHNRDFCSRKSGVQICVSLYDGLAVSSSVLGEAGQFFS